MRRSYWITLFLTVALVFAGAGCRKPEKPKSAKKRYEEAVAKNTREQMALDKFTASLREILQWRLSQEAVSSETQRQEVVKKLADKMRQVPTEGLSPEILKAWDAMLHSWQALAANPTPAKALRESGAEAARELNRQLEAHGVTDIRF